MRPPKAFIDEVTKTLVDQGLVIQAGWKGYELGVLSPDAGTLQRTETRMAFFAGAQHLFSSIFSILSPEAEPTEKDLERMSQIHRELERFVAELKLDRRVP